MKVKFFLILLLTGVVSGCSYRTEPVEQTDFFGNAPQCRQETNVAIYDDQGTFVVPGCIDYDQGYIESMQQFTEEKNDDEDESDFPSVPNNKYKPNQVVMENLNTRVLAYCRGTDAEIESCVKRLKDSCYTKVSEIPYMAAKYDLLTRGTYPTRRWRNGENVPRW